MIEVVVTGYGVLSPLGNSISEFSKRMFAGESGVVAIRGTRAPNHFPVHYAALMPELAGLPAIADDRLRRESEVMTQALLDQTLAQCSPELKIDGAILGTNDGGPKLGDALRFFRQGDRLFPADWAEFEADAALCALSTWFKKKGLAPIPESDASVIFNTCVTGNSAIGQAFQRIRSGRWKRALAGAIEQRIRAWNLMPFHLLGALCTEDCPPSKASCPFSKQRSGFVKGEGGALLLLESREEAVKRGAPILGSVLGFAQTSDAWRLTDGRPDHLGAKTAIERALADARISPDHVQYINAHGTSTPMNDRNETDTIKAVYGKRAWSIPISSLKSQVGHLNTACGAIEAVATLLMLQAQRLAPTINYSELDPDCDLDYVPNHAREARVEIAVSNSFGFGGANSGLVLKREGNLSA